MEKVIGNRVLLGELALGKRRRIVVAHHQPAGVPVRHKLVHPTAVDLVLLLIHVKARVACQLVRRHIGTQVKRRIWEICWKAIVWRRRILMRI